MDLQKAQIIALDMMKHHNLLGWSFRFDRSVTRLGLCSYGRRIISLGQHATTVNTEEQVLGTILHEIAHALVGHSAGHGPIWVAKARELGHSGNRCGEITVKAPAPYKIVCTCCNTQWNLYRLTLKYRTRLGDMWCKDCGRNAKGKLVLQATR